METKLLAVLFLIIGMVLGAHLFCSCTSFTVDGVSANIGSVIKEAYTQRDTLGSAISYNMNSGVSGSNNWENAAREYANQVGNQDNTKSGQYYTSSKITIPLIFAENPIKPECCPSYYSSSTGCVCTSQKQWDYLNQRGGNRTLNTEF